VDNSANLAAYPSARAIGVGSDKTSGKLIAGGHEDFGLSLGGFDLAVLSEVEVLRGPLALKAVEARMV
jgi:hypothetical protein